MIKKHDLRFKITDSPANRADEVLGYVTVSQTLLVSKFKPESVSIDHEQEAKERIAAGINSVVYGDVVHDIREIQELLVGVIYPDGYHANRLEEKLESMFLALITKLEWRDQ